MGADIWNTANSYMRFATNNEEAIRIDSSQNLLVGRISSSGVDTDGHVLFENGVSYQSNTDNGVQYVNRNGTGDGALTTFYKNGSTVGSIGTQSGRLTVGSGDTGLRFVVDADQITPWNTTTNSISDNLIDLGNTNNRFKDLYLSGNLIASGTGSQHSQIVSSGGDAKLSLISSDSHDAWINYSGATNEMSAGYDRGNSTSVSYTHLTLPTTPYV